MDNNKWKDKNEWSELDQGNWGELLGDDFKINPEDDDNFDDLNLEDFDLDEDITGFDGLELGDIVFEDYDDDLEDVELEDLELGDLDDDDLEDVELGDLDDDDGHRGWNFDGNWDFIEEDWD